MAGRAKEGLGMTKMFPRALWGSCMYANAFHAQSVHMSQWPSLWSKLTFFFTCLQRRGVTSLLNLDFDSSVWHAQIRRYDARATSHRVVWLEKQPYVGTRLSVHYLQEINIYLKYNVKNYTHNLGCKCLLAEKALTFSVQAEEDKDGAGSLTSHAV